MLAILVGVGVIAAIASGIGLPRFVMPAMTLVVIGWAICTTSSCARPRTGSDAGNSPPHDPD